MPAIPPRLVPILLLLVSNLFMTAAWYGHLRFKDRALWIVVLASWSIAFFEYWLAVPANRLGSAVYSAAQLKAIQEVATLAVFAAFSVLYLGQKITVNHLIGFVLIAAGASCSARPAPAADLLARGTSRMPVDHLAGLGY